MINSHFFIHLNFPSLPARHRPVRDQWDYTSKGKWNHIFRSKPGKPRRIAFTCFIPFPNNLNEGNLPNWFCQNGTANFGRTGLRGQSGPSQEWSLIFGQMELKQTFPFDTDRDFPKFWHNRRTPDHYIIIQVIIQTHQDDLKSSVMENSVNNQHPLSARRRCLRAPMCRLAVAWDTRLKPDCF